VHWARNGHAAQVSVAKHERPTGTFGWTEVAGGLCVRAGTRSCLQIDLKRGLGEQLLVLDVGHLGDDRPSPRREFCPRADGAIGTIAKHPLHLAASGCFARLDHLQRLLGIGSIARQHIHGP